MELKYDWSFWKEGVEGGRRGMLAPECLLWSVHWCAFHIREEGTTQNFHLRLST